MSEDTPEESEVKKPLWRRALKLFVKVFLVLAVVIFITLTVLSRIGGNGDPFKSAIQDFLTDTTPYVAHIQTLNSMTIFPSISVDVEGIELREGKNGTGEAAVRIASAKISMAFFDAMLRRGRFKNIDIQNMSTLPGVILEWPVKFDAINVENVEGQSRLSIQGKIGDHKLQAKIGLEVKGQPGRHVYVIGHERPLDIKLGALHLETTLKNPLIGGYKLENAELSIGEVKALRGNFDINSKDAGVFRLKGQGRLEPGKTQIDPDLVFDFSGEEGVISGDVKSDLLLMSDFDAKAPFMRVLDEVDAIWGTGKSELDLSGFDLDINVDAKDIKFETSSLGSVKTPLTIKQSVLHIGPLKGKIINGDLSGDIYLDAATPPLSLHNKITIKNFDYAALQKQLGDEAEIDGKGDIILDLKSRGSTLEALVDGLSGKAGFIGGKARMRSDLLNIWGGGLLNALLPSFDKESDINVNCVVVNFDIENLKGHSDAVFVDTRRITLRGKGVYDFKADNLEMVLEPKTKDIAIGDISSAVNVSGPLANLTTSPNVFDLGKKVGGLLLGAVNPAFYALTLADLGLRDDHPCKAFVIEKEILPPPEGTEEEPLLPIPAPEPAADTQNQSAPNE